MSFELNSIPLLFRGIEFSVSVNRADEHDEHNVENQM